MSEQKNRNFTMMPNELFQLYTKIPGFNGEHALMYALLTSYHNEEYGYAFPDQYELKLRLNCGINKVGRLAKKLREVELIDYQRRGSGGNYVYFVKQPIKDPQAFYERFPEAEAYYDEQYDAVSKRKETNLRQEDRATKSEDIGGEDFEELADWL